MYNTEMETKMAFTYTWSVTSLKVKDEVNSDGETLQNAVVQTYWKVVGTDENGNSGEFSGATPFTAKDVPAGSFVAFADLTEEAVLGWIKNAVTGPAGYMDHIDNQIQKRIDADIVAEKTGADLPWSVTPATPEPESAPE
jgi:hypothetical protein